MFQSTHSLRSATHKPRLLADQVDVSIHALLAECDTPRGLKMLQDKVSIHALLAECDLLMWFGLVPKQSFNPRTPCGVRLVNDSSIPQSVRFQSTHSLRSATFPGILTKCKPIVSIHALLAECDAGRHEYWSLSRCFNPRTPCGVRRGGRFTPFNSTTFQSTHSLRSATFQNPAILA